MVTWREDEADDLDDATPEMVGATANVVMSAHELVEKVHERAERDQRRIERLYRRLFRIVVYGVALAILSTYLAVTMGVRALVYCSNASHDVSQTRADVCNAVLWPSGVHYEPGPARVPASNTRTR